MSAAHTSEEKVLAVFDVLGTLFAKPDFRGCSFMNAVATAQMDSTAEPAQTARKLAQMLIRTAA